MKGCVALYPTYGMNLITTLLFASGDYAGDCSSIVIVQTIVIVISSVCLDTSSGVEMLCLLCIHF